LSGYRPHSVTPMSTHRREARSTSTAPGSSIASPKYRIGFTSPPARAMPARRTAAIPASAQPPNEPTWKLGLGVHTLPWQVKHEAE